jgi:hypothetical protein
MKDAVQTLLLIITICAPSSIFAELTVGESYRLNLTDIDGNAFSTADGHITTLVLISQSNIGKARAVGDRIPDFCLGNPTFRMITVLAFEKKHSKPARIILTSLMRRRADSEARRLQSRYDQLKIIRDARHDVLAVADFDGAITTPLGARPSVTLFHIFVFGQKGELLKEWNDVPRAEELAAALRQS